MRPRPLARPTTLAPARVTTIDIPFSPRALSLQKHLDPPLIRAGYSQSPVHTQYPRSRRTVNTRPRLGAYVSDVQGRNVD